MGRPEKPVDRTVPARANLADYLRGRKLTAGLTHEQMAELANGLPSKATFERAASGAFVPTWETVQAFVEVTITKEEEFAGTLGEALARARELWIRARRATRAPYYVHKAPDPDLISSPADFSRALRHQHVWAGFPTPGEMERMSDGSWALPKSTTRRIIAGHILPVDPQQTVSFLKACYVLEPTDLERWLAAAVRALGYSGASGKGIARWVKAHQDLLQQIDASSREEPRLRLLIAKVVDRQKGERERAA